MHVAFAVIYFTDGLEIRTDRPNDQTDRPFFSNTIFGLHTMAANGPLVVADALLDSSFRLDPLVTGASAVRFYAGIPLYSRCGQLSGLVGLFDTKPRDEHVARRIAEVASQAISTSFAQREPRQIRGAGLGHAAQRQLEENHVPSLAHSHQTLEQAYFAAKLGVWECDLADEKLSWTDGVYDIFELPRGSVINRSRILKCYTEHSRKALSALRDKAIRDRSGFRMDAEITTAKGSCRWIRITATVQSENGKSVRIFGMKQDITDEKILSERIRYLAEFDVMTGLANRTQFQARLLGSRDLFADQGQIGAVLLIDLDGFKQVNDTFGHALGDECLKEVAARLTQLCKDIELVARIGGDEFALLLGRQHTRQEIEDLAATIIGTLNLPIDRGGQTFKVGASVGIAYGDRQSASELFKQADIAMYAAKAAGRNTVRTFTAS